MILEKNVSLKEYNTFDIAASARYLITIDHEKRIPEALEQGKQNALSMFILGGGSNILFSQDYDGLVIKNEILGKEIISEDPDHVWVKLGAGEVWHQVVVWAIERGWGGIENLSLIPGTVGAAPMQNIGAYGVEICEVFSHLEAIELTTGKSHTFGPTDCQFDYRYSVFKGSLKNQFIITRVVLKLNKNPHFNISYGAISQTLEEMGIEELSIKAISDAVVRIRQSKLPDPVEIGNAGSFFKNPIVSIETYRNLITEYANIPSYPTEQNSHKIPAGWLIEQCDWKGFKRGPVGVHQNQALVLVNYGGASGSELVKLAHEIQESVEAKFGIKLNPEVNII